MGTDSRPQQDIKPHPRPQTAAHTPGPWRWLGHALVADYGHRNVVMAPLMNRDGPGAIMAMRNPSGVLVEMTDSADARLIEAAPDLLEACEEIASFAWPAVAADCEEAREELNRRLRVVTTAIARARGGR